MSAAATLGRLQYFHTKTSAHTRASPENVFRLIVCTLWRTQELQSRLRTHSFVFLHRRDIALPGMKPFRRVDRRSPRWRFALLGACRDFPPRRAPAKYPRNKEKGSGRSVLQEAHRSHRALNSDTASFQCLASVRELCICASFDLEYENQPDPVTTKHRLSSRCGWKHSEVQSGGNTLLGIKNIPCHSRLHRWRRCHCCMSLCVGIHRHRYAHVSLQ